MKKVFLLFAVTLFSVGIFASNDSAMNINNFNEEEDVIQMAFPVKRDGVYAGDADTITEALALCGLQ